MNNATVMQAVNTVNKARSAVLVVKEKGISSSSRSRPALVLGNFKELTRLSPNSTAKLSRSWEQVLVGFCAYKGFQMADKVTLAGLL